MAKTKLKTIDEAWLGLDSVDTELEIIDSTGHFESDDEVGAIFKQIKQTVNKLNVLRGIDVNDK